MPKVSQLPILNTVSTLTEIVLVDEKNTKKISYSNFFDQLRVKLIEVGYPGPQGQQGFRGVQGSSGVQGDLGVQGHQGPANGFQGMSGVQGTQGRQGNQGNQGLPSVIPGNQGIQGRQGIQGDPGGPRGFQGYQGQQGIKGDYGGPQGDPGAQGANGHQGNQGNRGLQGIQGAIGVQGQQGHQGILGIQGVSGIQGHQGINGTGVPSGGTQGQVLAKASNANNDVEWKNTAEIGLGTRQNLTTATGALANGASTNIMLTGYTTYALSKIQTSAAAWVRIYTDTTSRTNDAARTQDTDPLPGKGVIAEVITTSSALTQVISPGVIGFNSNSSDNSVFMAVTNKSGSSQSIDITLTLLKLEL